jgi:hypothetical protein
MPDFETHPLGTCDEIIYSRKLANAIQQLIDQYGEGIIPNSILVPYKQLYNLHQRHIENSYEGY